VVVLAVEFWLHAMRDERARLLLAEQYEQRPDGHRRDDRVVSTKMPAGHRPWPPATWRSSSSPSALVSLPGIPGSGAREG